MLILVLFGFLTSSLRIVKLSSVCFSYGKLWNVLENPPKQRPARYTHNRLYTSMRMDSDSEKSAPLLTEFAVKDYHRHTLGLADKVIDTRLKFQGGEIV